MMTSSRPRDAGGSFASRRGHGSQLSISDPSHHVTEAIGTLYGDSDDDSTLEPRRETRPLSFIASPVGGEQIQKQAQRTPDQTHDRQRLVRSTSDKSPLTLSIGTNGQQPQPQPHPPTPKKSHTLPARMSSQRNGSYEGPLSPMGSPMSPTLRDVQADSHGSQFPLTNIDNPNDIAQELSNLQALRRMSMDVGNVSDPDLPFQGMSLMAMPSIAPSGEDDEGDLSRLLWVPAKVHPEIAPDQFKNFLENRVQSIKRRSGESSLSVDGLQRANSGSLRRKKSMLSRQIDTAGGSGADGYVDGAERLGRKKSLNVHSTPELSLNELVKDPSKVVQKLAQESQRPQEPGSEEDMPILPVAPGMGLRRSTRTTYRKGGSLRAGDRVAFSKRIAARQAEKEEKEEESPRSSKSSEADAPRGHGLQRVQTEPVAENYSRPTRSVRRQQAFQRNDIRTTQSPTEGNTAESPNTPNSPSTLSQQVSFRKHSASSDTRPATPVPTIVTSPPAEDTSQAEPAQPSRPYPQRSSSQKAAAQVLSQQTPTFDEPPPRSSKRPALGRPAHTSPPTSPSNMEPAASSPTQQLNQTLNDMAQHPSPLPGSGSSRTDSLTFIPTFAAEDKKSDKKGKDKEEPESSKSSGWKWFKSEDKKKREKEEQGKKSRVRNLGEKVQEKVHDNARLDVLQSSIDNAVQKGRESLLLDRESIDNKLHEERKKESNRKTGDTKKEKDGFFGSFFGGSKKKEGKEGLSGKGKQRALSPEPPIRQLRPDIDYSWTRFPIVEERAIYRMAHIKLANPRRDLRSQVLLSNFMYSYLAKVQAMHPQLNVPVSPQQKRQEEERKRREQEEQQYLEQQQQQQQQQMHQQGESDSIDQYNFEYHRSGSNQYGDGGQQQDGSIDYIDDAQIFEYDHGGHNGESSSSGHQNGGGYSNHNGGHGQQGRSRNYYEYEQHEDGRRDDDDMW